MKLPDEVVHELRVHPGHPAGLDRRPTGTTKASWLGPLGHGHLRDVAARDLEAFKRDLAEAQELLFASDTWALLLVFQAVDAAGKDGTIKHVMSGIDPQGCQVVAFKQPSVEELRHDFLWRCARALPERGRIGIFNRSYYEEVLVVRVHPGLLDAQHLPASRPTGAALWADRYEDINAFERHLTRSGTRILKFFLHVSEEEQRRRFLDRIDRPDKRWKFSAADVAERSHFDEYRRAYEEALTATSTAWAPWYVVPADHKPAMRALVGGIVVHAIDRLDLRYPEMTPAQAAELAEARAALEAEGADGTGRRRTSGRRR
ncbi:MAG: PPK2 family polyphosphate kinase [Acidimicrobiales bacterium]